MKPDDGPKLLFPSGMSLEQIRSKLAGLHFSKEMLSRGEREILNLAESLLRYIDSKSEDSNE